MSILRFRADLHVEIVPPDMVFLLSEVRHYTLTGALYVALAPLLIEARYTAAQLADRLADRASAAQISYALHRLAQAGYTVTAPDSDGLIDTSPLNLAAEEAYFALAGLPATAKDPAGSVRRIGVQTFGVLPDSIMPDLIGLLGAAYTDSPSPDDLIVAVTPDYLHPDLAAFNQQMLAEGRAWLPVKPIGGAVWIGPLIIPGVTACWECLAQRLRRNRRVEGYVQNRLSLTEPIMLSRGALPSTIHTALALAVTEAMRWTVGHQNPGTQDAIESTDRIAQLTVLDTFQPDLQRHPVIRRPQCPACGDPLIEQPQPIELHSRPKVADATNGYRTERAQATFDRYQKHLSPITGAVTSLEKRFSNAVIHVYVSGNNGSRPVLRWENMRRGLRSLNGGKGVDDLQARVSALCEALERYSGQYEGSEPRQVHRYEPTGTMIHPAALLEFSDAQYANREALNAANPPNVTVPMHFDETRPIEWSRAWSLTDERWVEVPTAYSYFGYVLPADHVFCGADSNGNAAGSSIEDAILQGFLELVERDAVAIWWYNRVRRPGVRFEDPYYDQVRAYYASIGREIWLLDITTDFNIPVCAALSRRIDKPAEDIIMGFGAHLDFRIAALRALTEISQMLGPVREVTADGSIGYGSDLRWEIDWWQHATLAREPYLAPDSTLLPTPIDAYPIPVPADVRDDVRYCVDLARWKGLSVLVLDQTRPDIGLPVVKVMVPGLRHFWGRFAPGRLYDVPVALGWLAAPTREADLNPNPMTL